METAFTRRVRLKELLAEFPGRLLSGAEGSSDTPISRVVADSRQVVPGALFVACPGQSVDGQRYIPSAIEGGAAAVVGEQPLTGLKIPYLQVDNARKALAHLSAAYFGYPARRLTMIGVTGTDGKTTTCNLLYEILSAAGVKAGLISTVNAMIGDQVYDTGFHVTTPEAPEVQMYLAMMVQSGLTHAVLETTSHGWAQYRVDACEFDVGVITNITHEHLDYHGTFENYRAAKARLFSSLAETHSKPWGNPRLAVLNRDDSSFDYLAKVAPGSRVSYGLRADADVRALQVRQSPAGIHFVAQGAGFKVALESPLLGAYNVSNCLAALTAAACGLGIQTEVCARGIAALHGVPGRMERIDLGQPFLAYVDFAHTPNALRVAIDTARHLAKGRVIVVFGSAGLRDREKRRLMAEVSLERADRTILTAEDPRTESLEEILAEMAEGAKAQGGIEGENFWRIPDRGHAIRHAVQMAGSQDLVMACGKGHEQSMCFGTTEYPWDDRVAMRAALSESLGVAGPHMPFLPTQG
jgi:UDP-N-acetylmuramoyl-L-alanyl-D-glutamate--2,6-diaminopimelate ligase